MKKILLMLMLVISITAQAEWNSCPRLNEFEEEVGTNIFENNESGELSALKMQGIDLFVVTFEDSYLTGSVKNFINIKAKVDSKNPIDIRGVLISSSPNSVLIALNGKKKAFFNDVKNGKEVKFVAYDYRGSSHLAKFNLQGFTKALSKVK